LTKRAQHLFDVVQYVVLPITLDAINRLIELERYSFRKPMYRSILDQCTINGQELTSKMVYNEDAYGRLHCQTLTGIRASARDAVFKGFYQYDIKSCAPTILIEMYRQIEPGAVTPMLDEYIADPTRYRQELAEYLGIVTCSAKQVLKLPTIGQLYNAPVRFKITDYAGGNKNVVKLRDNERFMRLYNEVRTMLTTILRHHREIDSERIATHLVRRFLLIEHLVPCPAIADRAPNDPGDVHGHDLGPGRVRRGIAPSVSLASLAEVRS
jgi:hypothetical protein